VQLKKEKSSQASPYTSQHTSRIKKHPAERTRVASDCTTPANRNSRVAGGGMAQSGRERSALRHENRKKKRSAKATLSVNGKNTAREGSKEDPYAKLRRP